MPAYTSIQTHVRVDAASLQAALRNFKQCLVDLSLWSKSAEAALASFVWQPNEIGFVYTSNVEPVPLPLAELTVACRPLLVGIAPETSKLPHDTLVPELLFEEAEIMTPDLTAYRPGAGAALFALCSRFTALNSEGGVFVCDEGQDAQPWHWLVDQKPEHKWSFDIALIPRAIQDGRIARVEAPRVAGITHVVLNRCEPRRHSAHNLQRPATAIFHIGRCGSLSTEPNAITEPTSSHAGLALWLGHYCGVVHPPAPSGHVIS